MTQIQFGFTLPEVPPNNARRATFVEDVNRALKLVSGHFDSARIIDHLGVGDIESFTTLAYLAAIHPQLKFGHMVLCQSFRNPALVAMMGAAFQLLSGGRFLFGIGTGWKEEEYKAFGYDFPPARVRVEQLEDALQIIKAMWTEQKVTFLGKYYQVQDAFCEPKPDPLPPIMIGAFKPKMLRITAKYADEWNVSSTEIRQYHHLVAEFERACADVDRDPATVRRSWGGGCICMPTQADAIITPVSLSTKTPILPTSTLAAPPTSAPITEQPDSFEYPSVAEALADLKTRGDVSIEVSQGWTIVTEADGLTTWSFTPSDHPAYPAVAKRILYEDQDGWHIKMNVRCEAEKAACDQFVRDFEALNEQMLQYIEQQKKP
jgi:alkanesulfonate monooxygenase SsuD/methylene tetrahydromethanopterin reductase-like flavin-dependent oxidoreductase (luciferase family)